MSFESCHFKGVDTFVRYIVNEFLGEQWMTVYVSNSALGLLYGHGILTIYENLLL